LARCSAFRIFVHHDMGAIVLRERIAAQGEVARIVVVA
jgi:hypothetical protein